jgi:hypothetical protein
LEASRDFNIDVCPRPGGSRDLDRDKGNGPSLKDAVRLHLPLANQVDHDVVGFGPLDRKDLRVWSGLDVNCRCERRELLRDHARGEHRFVGMNVPPLLVIEDDGDGDLVAGRYGRLRGFGGHLNDRPLLACRSRTARHEDGCHGR